MGKNRYQEDIVEVCECSRCGHRWIPRINNPVMCPKCKSYYWDDWDDEDE